MKTDKRNDVHRRGAFRPEGYVFVGWYYMGRNYTAPKEKTSVERMSDAIQAWVTSQEAQDWKAELVYGDFGRCGVCGAHFMEGEVWQQNGDEGREMVHIGRDCAEKYEMVSGTGWTALHDERERAAKAAKTKARNANDRVRILACYPGLEEALKVKHYIIANIASRFESAPGRLTDKQVELVFKIAAEVTAKKAETDQEAHVAAPEGRQVVKGILMSKKTIDSPYGLATKMTVKVETPAGSWLCHGTAPSGLWRFENGVSIAPERGDLVEFTCTLNTLAERRDAHFAFFSRPGKAQVVAPKAQEVAKAS